MNRLASLLLLVTATGGCATDSSKEPTDPGPDSGVEEAPWPCASTTAWTESGKQTRQTYKWDEHHNLVFKGDDNGDHFAWTFDPSGTIAIVASHTFHEDAHTILDTTHRDVIGGRVMTEYWTHLIDGRQDSNGTTTFRYEADRLVEKVSTGSLGYVVQTEVWYEAPDSRGEVDRDRSGTVVGSRSWTGDPWTVMHSIGTDRSVDTIVTRRLDDHGLDLHRETNVYHSNPYLFVDIDRRPDGAPLREVWLDNHSPGQSRTITYQTACLPE